MPMESHGPAIVKRCADMDLEAHAVWADYPVKCKAIVDRCIRRMRSYGWSIVQGCADTDIDDVRDRARAEALNSRSRPPLTRRCREELNLERC